MSALVWRTGEVVVLSPSTALTDNQAKLLSPFLSHLEVIGFHDRVLLILQLTLPVRPLGKPQDSSEEEHEDESDYAWLHWSLPLRSGISRDP